MAFSKQQPRIVKLTPTFDFYRMKKLDHRHLIDKLSYGFNESLTSTIDNDLKRIWSQQYLLLELQLEVQRLFELIRRFHTTA